MAQAKRREEKKIFFIRVLELNFLRRGVSKSEIRKLENFVIEVTEQRTLRWFLHFNKLTIDMIAGRILECRGRKINPREQWMNNVRRSMVGRRSTR